MSQVETVRGPGDSAELSSSSAGFCEVSTAVRLLGDRWSLLIVRELAVGNTRFTDVHEALPGLSRSILASRLRYLERLRIVERRETPNVDRRSKQQYALTEVGWGLTPALRALGEWALSWKIPIRAEDPHDVSLVLRRMQESIEPSLLPHGRVAIQLYFSDSPQRAAYLRVDRTGAGLPGSDRQLTRPDCPVDAGDID